MCCLLLSASSHVISNGWYITFHDTDDYMRVVRIGEFFQHFDWSNCVVERSNVPYGCSLHWTRLYDFFIILPTYIVSFFVDTLDEAITYTCFCISPVIECITIVFIVCIFKTLLNFRNAYIVSLILISSPVLQTSCAFGRPDHHAFIILFMAMFLYYLLLFMQKKNITNILKLSIVNAACVWISPESLIVLLIADAVLYTCTMLNKVDIRALYLKNAAVSVIIFFIILDDISAIEYDKISIVHYSLYAASALFFKLISKTCEHKNLNQKILISSVAITFFAGVFLYMYPKFLLGMSGGISDYAKIVWLNKVKEMSSPFSGSIGVYCAINALVILTVSAFRLCTIDYKKLSSDSIIWIIIACISITYVVFSLFANRMLPYTVFFAAPLVVFFVMNCSVFSKLLDITKIVIALLFSAMVFIFINDESIDNSCCTYSNKLAISNVSANAETTHDDELLLYEKIDKLNDTPVVILSNVDSGPKTLYYTKHKVVASPYHRQERGIISSYKALFDTFNEDLTKDIIKETNAQYIMIPNSKSYKSDSLAGELINGRAPKWLQPIPMDANLSKQALLFKVIL